MDKLISIIIPCYNEEKNINRTFDELTSLARKRDYKMEVIAVNDGSKDNTWKVIKDYASRNPSIKGINFMTNFGQSCAYQAGFDMATGDYVLILSADLEIPVENIVRVVELLEEGYDFVNTNRQDRWSHEKASRQTKSGMANKILARLSHVDMKDRGSGLKGMRREIAKSIKFYGEMHRFIPDLVSVYTKNMTEFDVEFKDRDFGVSAYKGNKRTIKVLLDLVTLWFLLYFAKKPFYALPGRLFGFTGVVMAFFGFLAGAYLSFLKIFLGMPIGNRPLLILAMMLIVVGVQSFMLGLIGELMMRTYFESSGKKTYLIKEQI
jgi:glycosyltransferase involved in cell wall biosynthesis